MVTADRVLARADSAGSGLDVTAARCDGAARHERADEQPAERQHDEQIRQDTCRSGHQDRTARSPSAAVRCRGRCSLRSARGSRRSAAARRTRAGRPRSPGRTAPRFTRWPYRDQSHATNAADSDAARRAGDDAGRFHLKQQRAHQQRRLHAFARDHQQREREDAEKRRRAGLERRTIADALRCRA